MNYVNNKIIDTQKSDKLIIKPMQKALNILTLIIKTFISGGIDGTEWRLTAKQAFNQLELSWYCKSTDH